VRWVGPQQAAIFTMRADGSRQRRLTHSQFSEGGPSYSPNGRRIVFGRSTARPNQSVTVSMRSDGSDELILARGFAGAEYSPSGGRIVYGARSAIWKMRPDGSHKRQLTHSTAWDNSPHYSPDGRHIIFQRRGHTLVMRSDGSRLHRIDCGWVYSPNGRKFAWTEFIGDKVTYLADIFTSTVHCTDTFRVTYYGDSGRAVDAGPNWQPLPNR
jgi:dipeptidyl aminopeptidase/acylaminoacyl peptidase